MTEMRWQRWSRRVLAAVSAILLGGGAAWGIGFARFNSVVRQGGEMPAIADGIVVLTGGADRIETALHLLAEGRAPVLLVSGVARRAELMDLTRHVPLDAEQANRVTLGRTAQTTSGNAAETALWVHEHGIKRLIVVTAGYHMPRALLELQRALPDIRLHPVPVQPQALRGKPVAATLRMLANEYDKFLAVRFGLDRLLENGNLQ